MWNSDLAKNTPASVRKARLVAALTIVVTLAAGPAAAQFPDLESAVECPGCAAALEAAGHLLRRSVGVERRSAGEKRVVRRVEHRGVDRADLARVHRVPDREGAI